MEFLSILTSLVREQRLHYFCYYSVATESLNLIMFIVLSHG